MNSLTIPTTFIDELINSFKKNFEGQILAVAMNTYINLSDKDLEKIRNIAIPYYSVQGVFVTAIYNLDVRKVIRLDSSYCGATTDWNKKFFELNLEDKTYIII